MAGQRGVKRIEQVKVKTLAGDEAVQIYLDTRRSPTVFFADFNGERFSDTDMGVVDHAVQKHAETMLQTAFEPYIEFQATGVSDGDRFVSDHMTGRDGVSLRFQAVAVSPPIQGQRYEIPAEIRDNGQFHRYANPPRPRGTSSSKRLVPYTAERWEKFQQIKAVIEQARERLAEVLKGNEEQVARALDSGANATKLLSEKGGA